MQIRLVFTTILGRYVFLEITVSFLFSFAVFLITGLIAGFLPLLQKGMEAGMELTLILFQVLVNALPGTLVTVLPLSLTIGILLGLGRLTADNEVAAIKSAGISIVHLLPPVVLLGFLCLLLSFACTLTLIPKGITEAKRLMQEAATKRVDAGIEERTFFDSLKNLILYVEEKDPSTGILSRIFIRESSDPDDVKTIIARKGKIAPDPEGKALVLDLRNGTILKENLNGDSTGTLAFESYVFHYALDRAGTQASNRTFEEMPISGIREQVGIASEKRLTAADSAQADYYRRVVLMGQILITQRFTHPLACMALALIAFPIGLLNLGKSRLNNVSLGLFAIFIYYALTLATERMARSGVAPPELAMPLPALLFAMTSLYLMRCVRLERVPDLYRVFRKLLLPSRRSTA
ncbi:MAG: LptF/LptG family permease [Desulfomonile tiedjei]|uniref:LptF/LptG family permease n=1 Tax=Desulfomonile tiedjei TaxID=2358 RepID=A0A9D6V3S1_9BACT|nr:LptF/LptG family permease [Desulfomonile tiedjei]